MKQTKCVAAKVRVTPRLYDSNYKRLLESLTTRPVPASALARELGLTKHQVYRIAQHAQQRGVYPVQTERCYWLDEETLAKLLLEF